MSLLRRTGNGRNNIDWYNASSNSSGKYFKRTGTSRNNVQWINISSNGTHNLLERYNTTRNGIRWDNITFNFSEFAKYPVRKIVLGSGSSYSDINTYSVTEYISNGYNVKHTGQASSSADTGTTKNGTYFSLHMRSSAPENAASDLVDLINAYNRLHWVYLGGGGAGSKTLSSFDSLYATLDGDMVFGFDGSYTTLLNREDVVEKIYFD